MPQRNVAEARREISELLNRAAYAKERTVVTRHGKKVAAIMPIEDLEIIESLEMRRDFMEAVMALREAEEKGTISLDELKAKLGL